MSSAAQSPRGDTEEPAQSASPGREETEDVGADNNAPQDQDGPMNPDIYPDFEVKEQDRWLPIANGESPPAPCIALSDLNGFPNPPPRAIVIPCPLTPACRRDVVRGGAFLAHI